MGVFNQFLQKMDWTGMLLMLLSAVTALLCITVHELCHGLAAWKLGDDTAKKAGRLTLNPIRHIDPLGLLLMITVHVGWAKPVPVDMRNFKHPKRGMALTALAGPCSNFVMAFLALALAAPVLRSVSPSQGRNYIIIFLCYIALLSTGLGVFNLIPIPPLDGSKIVFSLLPERMYFTVLRHERKIGIVMLAVVWLGVLDGPLSLAIRGVLQGLCTVTGFPFGQIQALFF